MIISKSTRTNIAGDTIVEVLIAMAVVSLVLAGAYASTLRSSNAVRTGQEQGIALKIAESQLERIRQAAANTSSSSTLMLSVNECLDTLGSLQTTCTETNGINYRTTVSHAASDKNFGVKVEWDGLNGGINKVELFYRVY